MATFAIDLISGKVFLFVPEIGGSTGSTSGSTYVEVNTYADLPTPPAAYNGKTYLVTTSTGTYVVDRKEAGLYYSNGSVWYRLGDIPSFFDSNNFQIYDTNDNTKGIEFITSGITGGNFRELEVQDKDGTIALLSDLTGKVNISGDTMTGTLSVPELQIQTGATVTGHTVGGIHWNETDGTTDRHLKWGVTLQDGQETLVYGEAIETLVDGDAVASYGFKADGTTLIGKADIPLFGAEFYTGNDVGIMTSSAVSGQTCYVALFGKVRDVPAPYSGGTALYLSNTVRGELTDIAPVYPEQRIPMAFVAKSGVTDGVFLVNPVLDFSPLINNLQYTNDFFIGTFIDKVNQTITVSGGTVYITIKKDVVSGSTDFRVLVGTDNILTFSAQTITLIAGTEAVPVLNYVSMTAGGIQVNTGWFTGNPLDIDGAFAPVATILVQDAANVAVEGVYKHHGWIDRLITDTRGDNVKIAERLRQEDAQWDNGVLPTVLRTAEGGTIDRIDISNTQGIIYQKNRNTFPIRTTVGDGILVHVVNGNPNNYVINHIGEITGTSEGVVWTNNRRVNFVVWGVSSQNGTDCKIMVNTCVDTYGSDADAIEDPNNFSNYSVPKEYLGTGFLIARITANYTVASNGTWSILQTESLLGRSPNTSGGGGGGTGSAIAVKNSIERDVDLIYQLVNDELIPSVNKFYGVDSGGTKGFNYVQLDNTFTSFNVITGDTTLTDIHNNHVIHASGTTGSTGYTITVSSGVTIGFTSTIISFIPDAIITIEGQGTILSRGSANTMVNQYGGTTIQYIGNNLYTLIGDIT